MPIQYTLPGFKHMTYWSWAACLNHLTIALVLKFIWCCLQLKICMSWSTFCCLLVSAESYYEKTNLSQNFIFNEKCSIDFRKIKKVCVYNFCGKEWESIQTFFGTRLLKKKKSPKNVIHSFFVKIFFCCF